MIFFPFHVSNFITTPYQRFLNHYTQFVYPLQALFRFCLSLFDSFLPKIDASSKKIVYHDTQIKRRNE